MGDDNPLSGMIGMIVMISVLPMIMQMLQGLGGGGQGTIGQPGSIVPPPAPFHGGGQGMVGVFQAPPRAPASYRAVPGSGMQYVHPTGRPLHPLDFRVGF